MSAAQGFLVTGTDTGVGKTLVASALAAALSRHRRVAVFKPAETGCREVKGELFPEDADRLRRAAGSSAGLDVVCPFRYAEPLAPWIAAERAGRPIDFARLGECYRTLAEAADVVIVESAGGLLVPLTAARSFADLARELGLRVLVVVGSRLGAINQMLLTLECARGRGLEVEGYVLNHVTPESDLARSTNAEALARLADATCLAAFPWIERAPDLDREALAALGEPVAARLFPG